MLNKLLSPEDNSGGTGETEAQNTDIGGPSPEMPTAEQMLAVAVERYREAVSSMQGVVPELVRGDTIEEIDASAAASRQAYAAISRRIAEAHESLVPAGNPARSSADMAAAALKPEAKIALGLRRNVR